MRGDGLRRAAGHAAVSAVIALLACAATAAPSAAATREYDLVVAEGEVRVTGRPVRALTLNGGIPGPTLRFAEGDLARIRVRNELAEAIPSTGTAFWSRPGWTACRG